MKFPKIQKYFLLTGAVGFGINLFNVIVIGHDHDEEATGLETGLASLGQGPVEHNHGSVMHSLLIPSFLTILKGMIILHLTLLVHFA